MKRLEIIEKVQQVETEPEKEVEKVEEEFKVEWVWVNVIGFVVLHYWFFRGVMLLGFNKITLFSKFNFNS